MRVWTRVWRFELNLCTFNAQTAADGRLAQSQAHLGDTKTGQTIRARIHGACLNEK